MGNNHAKSRKNNLIYEIGSLEITLLELDKGETVPRCSIADHAERISKLLLKQSHRPCFPIHELLRVSPLANTEIPLNILEMLASEFDVNERMKCADVSKETCLGIAITNEHYNAVRFLIKHGADCNIELYSYERTWVGNLLCIHSPLALLAEKSTAPMDLFDLLQTDHTLNDSVNMINLPLHLAVKKGYSEAALRLIQLGASVDTQDFIFCLPIEYYQKSYSRQFHAKLFEKLVPSRSMDILRITSNTLYYEKTREIDGAIWCKMIRHLVQRLIHIDALSVTFQVTAKEGYVIIKSCNNSEGNANKQFRPLRCPLIKFQSEPSLYLKRAYLTSLLILHLNWNCMSVPEAIAPMLPAKATEQEVAHAHALDGIWDTYRRKPRITSLLTLCIQQTRKHMNSLTDSSFMSLPVPASVRRLLMYRHIADIVWEAWRVWPECNTTCRPT